MTSVYGKLNQFSESNLGLYFAGCQCLLDTMTNKYPVIIRSELERKEYNLRKTKQIKIIKISNY